MAKASKASEAAASRMSANARFKQTFGAWLWGGVVVATVFHFGLFQLFPELTASDVMITPGGVTPVIPIPDIDIPEPPEPIPQPKVPVVGDTDPLESVTIPPTTIEDNVVGLRPPGEEVRARDDSRFAPYTVRPELRDRAAATRIVEHHYPRLLKDAGIGGQVDVLVLIDTMGVVRNARVKGSSGNASLDEAALRAAREFRFTPALNRDLKVSVWLEIPIVFSVRR